MFIHSGTMYQNLLPIIIHNLLMLANIDYKLYYWNGTCKCCPRMICNFSCELVSRFVNWQCAAAIHVKCGNCHSKLFVVICCTITVHHTTIFWCKLGAELCKVLGVTLLLLSVRRSIGLQFFNFILFFTSFVFVFFSMYVAEILMAAALVWLAVLFTVHVFKNRDIILLRAVIQPDGEKDYILAKSP